MFENFNLVFINVKLILTSVTLEKSQNFYRDFIVVFAWFSKIPQYVKKPNVVILWLFEVKSQMIQISIQNPQLVN